MPAHRLSLYPSLEWLQEYGRLLDESATLDDVAAEVETTHLFPRVRDPAAERIVDEALRGPIRIQQTIQRNAMRSGRMLGLW